MNARHSKATPRWGTPAEWVEPARVALGGRIELDPMSEPRFNETVRAERFYTEQDDGLVQDWTCETMLLNPAGGQVIAAWQKLTTGWESGQIKRCVWFSFNVDQLNLLADDPWHPLDFSLLLSRRRIEFVRHDGYQGSPAHANYIVGLGIEPGLFESAFSGRGRFHHGKHAVRRAA